MDVHFPAVGRREHRAGGGAFKPSECGWIAHELGVPEGGAEGEDGLVVAIILGGGAAGYAFAEAHVGGLIEDDLPGFRLFQVGKNIQAVRGAGVANGACI